MDVTREPSSLFKTWDISVSIEMGIRKVACPVWATLGAS